MWFSAPPPPPPSVSRLPPPEQALVFLGLGAVLCLLLALQRSSPAGAATWLPAACEKRAYEVWVLRYSVFWMALFGAVVAFEWYESFDAFAYTAFCGALALPLALQPLLGDAKTPLGARHAARAQLWMAIFGFIGNYWYTHYFYNVLRARYTMPAWRVNDVPICM